MSIQLKESGVRDVVAGENVTIVAPVNLYECTLGNEVFVGPFTEIQKGVTVGNRTRIQSHSFLCTGVHIGEDCFISHGVMFVNDTFANGGPAGEPSKWHSTYIGDKVSIGSNATILPVTICSNTVIGAGAVVTKDIKEPGVYAGNPARLIRHL
jgi:acetyltransferase-like isoleucine patch superfamily enzyme